jgi:hypothetical protein
VSINPLLRWPVIVGARVIALMSGVLSLFREVRSIYTNTPTTSSLFWSCAWIAFIVSASTAWYQEHLAAKKETEARTLAENALNDAAPKLFLEYSENHAAEFMTYTGLFVRNSGKQQAFKVDLLIEMINGFGFLIEGLPIEHVDPEKRWPIDLRTGRDDNGTFRPTGGVLGGQVDSLFDHLVESSKDESFPVTIKYQNYDGKEFVTRCVIRREGRPWSKRIWCELVHSP